MRRTLGLLAVATAFSMMAWAEDWTGKLLDAPCYDRQSQQKSPAQAPGQPKGGESCMATSQTTAFALQVADKVYKLDSAGNTQAMTALRNRADRSAPGKEPSEITAHVSGTESGGTIRVEKIDLQ